MLETVVLKRIEKTHSTVLYGIIPKLLPDQGQVCGLESKFIKPLKNYSNCTITVRLQSFMIFITTLFFTNTVINSYFAGMFFLELSLLTFPVNI